MTIKDGYDGKPFEILVNGHADRKIMELWFMGMTYPTNREKSDMLSYMTIEEAVELRNAINKALKDAIGV